MENKAIHKLWEAFSEISVDANDCIEQPFHIWPQGTDKLDIWHWFDDNHSSGVYGLMFNKRMN